MTSTTMSKSFLSRAGDLLPNTLRETLLIRLFGFIKIPVLFYVRPSVVVVDATRCVVKIPLRRRTKNHLNSMYFGVLAAGADCAGGLIAMQRIRQSGKRIDLIFKDFHADFKKRVEGDCLFTCADGAAIDAMLQEVVRTGERVSGPVKVIATVPSKLGDEPVAEFTLTLSLKERRR